MSSDLRIILTADRLVEAGHITPEERRGLIDDGQQVADDTAFPVDVCDNGDVFIHNRGSYPLILKSFASRLA